jgi:lysosomal Pro-X carboxypeptidase
MYEILYVVLVNRGSAPACSDNIRRAWPIFFDLGKTQAGRDTLSSLFQMCTPLKTQSDVDQLALFVAMAWDTMAMGNFPYPSSYLTGGGPLLPAYPVRVACQQLAGTLSDDNALLSALSRAAAVYNNATQNLQCFDLPSDPNYDGIWDYQWCTQTLPQESYFGRDGVNERS